MTFQHFKEEHHYNEFQCLRCLFGSNVEVSIRYHMCRAHADYQPAAVARVKASNASVSKKCNYFMLGICKKIIQCYIV